MEFIKKHIVKSLVLISNLLLMGVVTLVIKDQDQKDKSVRIEEQTAEVVPIGEDVNNAQNAISIDRENKLRDLNNTPTETKTTQVTTKTTTTTPATSTSTRKTKTS
jgi:hypothetical protein